MPKAIAACVYCGANKADSRDHIISAFLGGKRRVPSCAVHNHAFGHTFEAEASKQLLAWTVTLASWGVPLQPMKAWYERALTIDGRVVDLRLGAHGLEFCLHKPVVQRDTQGALDKLYLRSERENRAFIERMRQRDPHADWRPFEERVTADLRALRPSFEATPSVHQLALKISIAAASRLPSIQLADLSQAAQLLYAPLPMPSTKTAYAFGAIPGIDVLCPPLAHTVYIEHRVNQLEGRVSFFGVFQLATTITKTTTAPGSAALLLTTDPVTGEETIRLLDPLGIPPLPSAYTLRQVREGVAVWSTRLVANALACGATRTPQVMVKVRADPHQGS